jgi:hypothetical protein
MNPAGPQFSLGNTIIALGLMLHCACSGDVEPVRAEIEGTGADSGDAGARRDTSSEREPTAELGPADAEPSTIEFDAAAGVDAAAAAPDGNMARDAGNVDAGPCEGEPPLARGLRVRELALYQTVKLPLYRAGAWVSATDLPIVAGKRALLRVFVDTSSGYAAHRVRAVLELAGKQGTSVQQDDKTLATSSSDADPESTFAFAIDGAKIAADTQISVSLVETECDAAPGRAVDARVPTTGSRSLGATVIGKLKVVLIPIEVGGRLPKTDLAEQTRIRDALLAYYPVADVELSVRSKAVRWSGGVGGGDSSAWSNLLNQVLRERNADNADSDVYYYGLMQPAATFAAFCGRGCIVGMAPETTRVSPTEQAGVSVYFTERSEVARTSVEAIVHELGHAHGRGHAPCVESGTIRGVDANFPDRTGATGAWGWDSRSDTLMPPTHKDVMGYCSPDWISPYTYGALAGRSLRVNSLSLIHGNPSPVSWHRVLLYADGSARWGGDSVGSLPGGELESVAALDSDGRAIAKAQIVRVRLSHSDDQILYLPTAPAAWAALELSDRTLALERIAAPL